jgi:hypothetical protein
LTYFTRYFSTTSIAAYISKKDEYKTSMRVYWRFCRWSSAAIVLRQNLQYNLYNIQVRSPIKSRDLLCTFSALSIPKGKYHLFKFRKWRQGFTHHWMFIKSN